MSTTVATRADSPKTLMHQRLDRLMPALEQVAASHLDPHRLVKMALVACERTPTLFECSPKSILLALLQAADMGLDVGGGFGHAYLVPFKGSATLVVGYQGYIELMYRTGHVTSVRAVLCFEADDWEYEEGSTPRIVHRPHLGADRNAATLRFAYAMAHLRHGGPPVLVVLTKQEVEAARKRSASSKRTDSPWNTDYLAMALKTPVRRLAKLLPKSRELAQALDSDDVDSPSASAVEWQRTFDQALDAHGVREEPPSPSELSGSEAAGVTYDE